jgi:hypothetical protein
VDDHQRRLASVRALIADEPDLPLPHGERGDAGGPHRSANVGRSSGSLERLCRAAARAMSASGVGLSVMTDDGAHGVVAGSDATSTLVEELQFTTGEGPCVDAVASGRPVLSADLNQMMTRWPGYAPAAHGHGVRAVFAFPLQIGALRMGAMDVYCDRPGSLTGSAVDQALAFAEVAMLTVLDGQDRAPAGEPAAVLQDGLIARAELYQAQGMVSAQLGVDLVGAMIRLRAHAYAYDRPLIDIARDVLARRLDLKSDRHYFDDGGLDQRPRDL